MNRPAILLLISVVVLVALLTLQQRPKPQPAAPGQEAAAPQVPLRLYCAASNRPVMEKVLPEFQQETGIEVQVEYGPSQTLLSTIKVNQQGDLYLPADDSYIEQGRQQGLLAEAIPLAKMNLVLCVPKGNPQRIQSLADILNSSAVRLVQAEPDAAAVGKQTRDLLSPAGQWEPLRQRTAAMRSTVMEVANDVRLGAADVGIVYDAVLHGFPELEAVRAPELDGGKSLVTVAVVQDCQQPARALQLARYLGAADRGQKTYQELGFEPVNGDPWKATPELTLYAGSMLRPAIEQTLTEFEAREGCRITRVYNGCGILVTQMQAGQVPDAYFACDVEFMRQVQEMFPQPVDVSTNELVILVKKGNPLGIATLQDLGRPGLRVGVGHEKQCAMGWLTERTLTEGGVKDSVMTNVTVQSATGDLLVNQLKSGALDAAVAYVSNAAGSAETLDAIRIEGLACSKATQPFAIGANTRFPQLVARLYARLAAAESQERFLQEGFQWSMPAERPSCRAGFWRPSRCGVTCLIPRPSRLCRSHSASAALSDSRDLGGFEITQRFRWCSPPTLEPKS